MTNYSALNNLPNYSVPEAAFYLRLKAVDIHRWVDAGIIRAPQKGLSFLNILELHILKGLRKQTGLPMQRIRKALEEYGRTEQTDHPLLDKRLETNGIHLFLHEGEEYVNLNKAGQMGIPQILVSYLKRIDRLENGQILYFPFIAGEGPDEPRTIQMTPGIAFGRPVLAHTGIAADVIVGRFKARDTISDLAQEYDVSPAIIEDCLRWELPLTHAA